MGEAIVASHKLQIVAISTKWEQCCTKVSIVFVDKIDSENASHQNNCGLYITEIIIHKTIEVIEEDYVH